MSRAAPLAALLAGCCCFGLDAAPTVVTLEGPVRAELAYARDGYGGFTSSVRVISPIAAEIRARCVDNQPPELVGDGTPHRIAYRCRDGEAWTLVYVGPSALVAHCASVLGAGTSPDFARAPATLPEAAGELGACAEPESARNPWRAETFPRTFEQARLAGPSALVGALVLARPHPNATGWDEFARGLDPAALGTLRATLRAELRTEAVTAPGTCRALDVLGDDDDAVIARAEELIGSGRDGPACAGHADGILAALQRRDPNRARALACSVIEDVDEGSPIGRVLAPLHVVAESDRVCDVRRWLEWMRCYPGLRCGESMCTDPDAITPGPEAETHPEIVDGYRDVLRVALRSGPLPAAWVAREGCRD